MLNLARDLISYPIALSPVSSNAGSKTSAGSQNLATNPESVSIPNATGNQIPGIYVISTKCHSGLTVPRTREALWIFSR